MFDQQATRAAPLVAGGGSSHEDTVGLCGGKPFNVLICTSRDPKHATPAERQQSFRVVQIMLLSIRWYSMVNRMTRAI
ncbi:MAG: hypothetical protein CMM01_25020 [Rhodopirellula sp.]|nr:hypothetical protein [Rhodopirellula sp.]OUX49175.1 MAG: hypothetical protein CBE43_10655 [Rhodopirellula sp. TMED283]